MESLIQARVVVAAEAQGEILHSDLPLSFWGGYDQASGEIIDRRHPLSGHNAAGKVLAVPATRGSSTTTAVMLEAVRAGKAPVALLTTGVDTFLALASIVARELYDHPLPVMALQAEQFARLKSGDFVHVMADGRIILQDAGLS